MSWKSALAVALAAAFVASVAPCAAAEDVVIKVWSLAQRSGPLRAGNLVTAGDTLNKMLASIGSDKRVKIELNETNAKGYDDDALDLLKAFSVDKGPDIFVLAHEWTGAFVEAGYAQNLEDHIAKNPELYGDIIGPLWQATTYKGARYGVPQDSEVRMFFLNNDKLRKMGMSEKDIAALPAKVDAGEFTMNDLCDLAGQAVSKGVAKYGILHRPNAGPDFQMLTESFGAESYDKSSGKLEASKSGLRSFYTVGQVLHGQEGAVGEQYVDVVGRDRAGVLRR
jgi:inositol-phosphate transport system substrate-binding protein